MMFGTSHLNDIQIEWKRWKKCNTFKWWEVMSEIYRWLNEWKKVEDWGRLTNCFSYLFRSSTCWWFWWIENNFHFVKFSDSFLAFSAFRFSILFLPCHRRERFRAVSFSKNNEKHFWGVPSGWTWEFPIITKRVTELCNEESGDHWTFYRPQKTERHQT